MISKTAPGVYTSVRDDSFLPARESRFRVGLLGVAERGPFDQAVSTRSLKDFVSQFGSKIGDPHLLADVATMVSSVSDGAVVVRIGAQYASVSSNNASGNASQSSGAGWTAVINTPQANLVTAGEYVRVTQPGKATTVNAQVHSVSGSSIRLNSALADSYTAGFVDKATSVNAANKAEGFADRHTYGSAVPTYTVAGNKSEFVLEVTGAPSSGTYTGIAVGDLIKVVETGKATTREARVKSLVLSSGALPGYIYLEAANLAAEGVQAVSLQANYTAATLYVAVKSGDVYTVADSLKFEATTEGTWANTTSSAGLSVKVGPGTSADTKKVQILHGGAVVEIFDNLSLDSTSDNYYETRINDVSGYVTVSVLSTTEPPANTINGWDADDVVNSISFSNGFNGENVTKADYIGTVDPVTEEPTGLKVLEDTELGLSMIAACQRFETGDDTIIAVAQEGARIGEAVHAEYLLSVPKGLNLRQATDWHNGEGLYSAESGRLDTRYAALFWNHCEISSPLDGEDLEFFPPHLAAVIQTARSFSVNRPWLAVAGEKRGTISFARNLEFRRVSEESRNSSYGDGNAINPIIIRQNRIMIFGNRTLQRTESKLSALNNMFLTNYIMRNLGNLARQFVFDPNDDILLAQLNRVYTDFLQSVQNDRGIEEFELVIDGRNNTATTRNERRALVDLAFVPTDAAERIEINATVRESGAILNTIS